MKFFLPKKASSLPTLTLEAYVPNRDRDGALFPGHATWLQRVEAVLGAVGNGGTTTYRAVGTWAGKQEDVWVVRAAVDARRYHEGGGAERVAEVLGAFGVETNQEVAGWTVDGQWFFAQATA